MQLRITHFEQKKRSFTFLEEDPSPRGNTPSDFKCHENDHLEFSISLPQDLTDIKLHFGDIPQPPSTSSLTENNNIEYYWKARHNFGFFQNICGTCALTLEFRKDDHIKQVSFKSFEVLPKKASIDDILAMVEFISNHEVISSPILAATYQPSFLKISSRKNILSCLKEIFSSTEIFYDHLGDIKSQRLYKLVPSKKISPYASAISNSNPDWILDHLDELVETSSFDTTSFKIGRKYYTPSHIEVDYFIPDTDIYENRVLHNYINECIIFLKKFIKNYHYTKASENEYSGQSLSEIIHNENNKYYHYFIEKANINLKKLIYIKQIFEKIVPVTTYQSGCLFTAKAKANLIYRKFFEKISIWNQIYDYTLGDNNEVTGIQTIDKLYEKFCLFKIIDIILDSGYELIEANGKKFFFSGNKKNIELYYELDFSSGDNTYGYMAIEKWNLHLKRNSYSHRIPDFSLFVEDISSKGKNLYIFDAKYTDPKTAFNIYLKDCTFKYIHGIATDSNLTALSCYILYHGSREYDTQNKEFHYTKDTKNIFSKNPLFPCLGTIETNRTNDTELEKIVKRILSLNIVPA